MTFAIHGNGGSGTTTANTTQYAYPIGVTNNWDTTEANRQIIYREAGTLSRLHLRISGNSVNATTTFVIRVNGVDGNLSIDIPSGQTGFFEDMNNSDTIAAGDKLCFKKSGGTTGTFNYNTSSMLFRSSTAANTVTRLVCAVPTTYTTGTNKYNILHGQQNSAGATESDAKVRQRKSGTYQSLSVHISANARTTTTTVRTRKNGANGNQTFNISAGATGFFEDTTHTDTVVAGDDFNTHIVLGASSENLTVDSIAVSFVTASSVGIGAVMIGNVAGRSTSAAATDNLYFTGQFGTNSTEGITQTKAKAAFTLSEATINVTANTITATSTVRIRKNSADSSIAIPIPSSSTGIFSDSSNTEDVAINDTLNWRLEGGATGTSITYKSLSVWTTRKTDVATPSDTITLSESKLRTVTHKCSLTDSKTLSESISKISTHTRLTSDTKTLSESLVRTGKLKRLKTDTTILDESTDSFFISGGDLITRSLSDTTTRGESLTRSVALVPRTASDTSTLSESNIRMLTHKRLDSDSTTLSESNIRRLSLKRLLSDTTTLSESIIRRATKIRLLSNTITLSESLARALRLARAISDTKTLSESISRVLKSIRLLTDTKTLSEVIDTIVGTKQVRTPSDTTTLSESLLRHLILSRAPSENTSLSDSLIRRLLLRRALTDTTTLSDSLVRHLLLKRLLSDTKTLSESIIRAALQIRMPSADTITLSDSIARILRSIRRPIDSITVSELAISSNEYLRRIIDDTIALSEAIDTPLLGLTIINLSDTITLSESLIRYGSTIVLVTDTITLSELVTNQRAVIRRAEDFIGKIRYKRHITNTTSLTESILRLVRPLKHPITDDITLSEDVVATLIPTNVQAFRRATDTITLSQTITRQLSHTRAATESMLQRSDPASEDIFYGLLRKKVEEKKEEEEPPKVAYVTPATHEVESQISKIRDHSLFKRRNREKGSIFY